MSDVILKNISKEFKGRMVLNDFSIIIEEGKSIAVMGHSGGGKSTLLNIIAGLVTPDSGEIQGLEEKKISYLFQTDRLFENYSVMSNIKAVCPEASEEEIYEFLEELGLGIEFAEKKAGKLSGGEARRVAIARTLLSRADLYLMDEPIRGLDAQLRESVTETIRKRLEGKTAVIVTHDREEAERMGAGGNIRDIEAIY